MLDGVENAGLTLVCIGNTGSGKSTFMNALFSGADFENGPFSYDCRGQACTDESTHVE